ncbi:MAG TPA: hypothetical protein VGS22_04565 [Thermoanaerobaculia bacterium]|jgi:Leucine-rich repeat (LRR) protein|nr:hypothetical protein [Thermoanaerobaculia bacterium]
MAFSLQDLGPLFEFLKQILGDLRSASSRWFLAAAALVVSTLVILQGDSSPLSNHLWVLPAAMGAVALLCAMVGAREWWKFRSKATEPLTVPLEALAVQLSNALASHATAIVVLQGTPGSGKTRFLKTMVLASHEQGAKYVDLDGTETRAALLNEIKSLGSSTLIIFDHFSRFPFTSDSESAFSVLFDRVRQSGSRPCAAKFVVVLDFPNQSAWNRFKSQCTALEISRIETLNMPRLLPAGAHRRLVQSFPQLKKGFLWKVIRSVVRESGSSDISPLDLSILQDELEALLGIGLSPRRLTSGHLEVRALFHDQVSRVIDQLQPTYRTAAWNALGAVAKSSDAVPRQALVAGASNGGVDGFTDWVDGLVGSVVRAVRQPAGLAFEPLTPMIRSGILWHFDTVDLQEKLGRATSRYLRWSRTKSRKDLLRGSDLDAVTKNPKAYSDKAPGSDNYVFLSINARRLRLAIACALVVFPLVFVPALLSSLRRYQHQEEMKLQLQGKMKEWGLPLDLPENIGPPIKILAVGNLADDIGWLPDTLCYLDASQSKVREIASLPKGLLGLAISYADLTPSKVLPRNLPRTLKYLRFEGLEFPTLTGLPDGLEALEIRPQQGIQFTGLPKGLRLLRLHSLPTDLDLHSSYRNLVQLDVLESPYVSTVANLPPNLRIASFSGTGLSSLSFLPDELQHLVLVGNQNLEVSVLPRDLRTLRSKGSRFSRELRWPSGLTSLSLDRVPAVLLPTSIKKLSLEAQTQEESLEIPELVFPVGLTDFELNAPAALSRLVLPNSVRTLTLRWVGENVLSGLNLANVRNLTIGEIGPARGRDLTPKGGFAVLPKDVESLTLTGSIERLAPIVGLEELRKLKVRSELLVELPDLPPNLRELDLTDCLSLNKLPNLPENLQSLKLRNVPVVSEVKLPSSLEYLDIAGSGVRVIPNWPSRLEVLVLSEGQLAALRQVPRGLHTLLVTDGLAVSGLSLGIDGEIDVSKEIEEACADSL